MLFEYLKLAILGGLLFNGFFAAALSVSWVAVELAKFVF